MEKSLEKFLVYPGRNFQRNLYRNPWGIRSKKPGEIPWVILKGIFAEVPGEIFEGISMLGEPLEKILEKSKDQSLEKTRNELL